ncbi:acetyl-CoA carboxylase biotin carboxyl carrier protein subunit [Bradyrhizobium sp. WYCCWR 13023]|uniref:Biotin carboxyl carrier protein of acetyl-CoA carboxylase n=1 Tax=Bradyrhizobium zhengyangense TaxID=2911009 RepID=A0A9X1R5Q1_9BRAD|nr:acetyl-CoA carboxylase biotin carboxyl carrier protein subunit [Bradyrhizobium zhengyangense]MCG2626734.1 acetyl-CoA carboxylase biotin carboxyl carrier protein subunit [Bradyrhizobium zhengyangense]MCG2638179.1 acetyl-CoA carboxylase biotin carboxyl carrier protein subunit [Bradyrhizobium zhengyangense]MCG2666578.1 acetyl-CoA carboxylase biotin carboxyl carrier protein subunit [Bradyrhizobium zhengyangense]
MDVDRIKSLIDAMTASDLNEMEFSEGGWSLRLVRRAPPNDMVRAPVNTAPSTHARQRPTRTEPDAVPNREANVAAPLFGIVHLQPAPDARVFVSVGQVVTAGTPLCIIEAMKMFHEVRAEQDGTVSAILVASGEEVQAGQELMRFA